MIWLHIGEKSCEEERVLADALQITIIIQRNLNGLDQITKQIQSLRTGISRQIANILLQTWSFSIKCLEKCNRFVVCIAVV